MIASMYPPLPPPPPFPKSPHLLPSPPLQSPWYMEKLLMFIVVFGEWPYIMALISMTTKLQAVNAWCR